MVYKNYQLYDNINELANALKKYGYRVMNPFIQLIFKVNAHFHY